MKISEAISKLNRVMNQNGNLDIVVHNYANLGDLDILLETENFIVRDNTLFIE